MKNTCRLLIIATFIMIPRSFLQAEEIQQSKKTTQDKNIQQNFIAKNGEIGIYQPNQRRAYIGDDSYIRVKQILTNGQKKSRKPYNSIPLGKLIDGNDIYELYGKNEHPAPVYDGPDSGVRTEDKLSEDFMRNFGSGQYTPDDKWD